MAFICCYFYSIMHTNGQPNNVTIIGHVFDSTNLTIPSEVKFSILQNDDTISINSEFSSGLFKISGKEITGKLVLQIEAPFYNSYRDTFNTKEGQSNNLDTIYLTPTHLLNEVTVQGGYKSKIDKDTASFTADSFIIKQFDNAEQLLQKIPGIEITQNKGIQYYGQPINEISIGGIPFSSFDIHSLLKLLRGRDVDKLKIYDTKASMGNIFLEKGKPEKALNIILKEEAKHGYYGKLSVGSGTPGKFHWDNTSNASSFNDNRNVVGYVTTNNTENASSYGESELSEQNIMDAPRGIPTNISAGVHYDSRFLNNKLSFNGNYRILCNNQNANTEIVDINFLASDKLTTTTQSRSNSKSISNNATIQTSYNINPSSSLNLTANSSIGFSNGSSRSNSDVENGINIVSSSQFQNVYRSHAPQTSLTLSYINTFRNGSNFNCSFSPSWNSNIIDANQSSILNLVDSSNIQKSSQQKNNKESNSTYLFISHYKASLTKQLNIDLNWQSVLSKSRSLYQTYDIYSDNDNSIKDSLNTIYSNDYTFFKISNNMCVKLLMKHKRYSVQLGTDFNQALWNQENAYLGIKQKRSFINILPFGTINIKTGKTSFAGINYKLQYTQPTLSQIQPLINNNNPLQIIIGNPDLVQTLAHNVGFNYTNASKDGNQSFNVNSNISIIQNAISIKQVIDENGRQLLQYYNQNGNHFWNIASYYDIAIAAKIRLSVGINTNRAKAITVVNNKDNIAHTNSYGSKLSLAYTKDTTFSLRFNSEIAYSLNTSSLSSNNNIINYTNSLNANYGLPFFGLTLGTSILWNCISSNIDNNSTRNYFIWHAYIQRCINKSQSLSIKLYAHDLLNQNNGYLIYAENNIQHEETYNSIGRYFLLGFIWNFTKR